jgi:SAM-dependent methyltransferase
MFKHVAWPLNGFDSDVVTQSKAGTRYPIRFLRYWFPRLILENMYAEKRRPLAVLEIGVGDGRMAGFLGGEKISDGRYKLPSWIERWDGVDVVVSRDTLERYSYTDYIEADIERPFDLKGRRYDAIVMIHVLEHLFDPDGAMLRLSDSLKEGGVIIGGSPTMPYVLAAPHERWLRRSKFRDKLETVTVHRHLSVISPGRIKRFARRSGLSIDLLAGTFFCRWTGIGLENTASWARANLLWGAAVPSLGGEIYFSLQRT